MFIGFIAGVKRDYSGARLVPTLVFNVINMLECNMVARAAVDMIDGDHGVVALSKRDIVIRLR